MLDLKLIREHPELVKENIKKKFQNEKLVLVDKVLEIDKQWRELKFEEDSLRASRNKISKEISELKKAGKDAKDKIKEAGERPTSWQLGEGFGFIRATAQWQNVDLENYRGFVYGVQRYHGGFRNVSRTLERLMKREHINDMPSLLEFLSTRERARELAWLLSSNERLAEYAFARALAVRFPEHFAGKSDFIEPEQLREYTKGNRALADMLKVKVDDILEKDELLRHIVLNMARDRTFGDLGGNPTEDQINSAYRTVYDTEQSATEPWQRQLLTNIRREFEAFMDTRRRYD